MAQRAYETWGTAVPDSAGSDRRAAWSAWWFVKHRVHFKHHDQQLIELLNEGGQQQLLIAPSLLLRMDQPEGDCAVFTMAVACLLECLGVPWQIVTVKADPGQPDRWSHVYAAAVLGDGRRVPLDASHGEYPGWEVPGGHMFAYQAWDRNGVPVAGRPSVQSGLNGYRRRGVGFVRRGFGDETVDIPTITTPEIDLSTLDQWLGIPQLGTNISIPGVPASSTSGFNLGSTVSNLLNQWTQIGSKVLAPTTTIYNPQTGQYVSTPAGSTAAASLLSSTSTSGSTLLVLGAGLAALLLLVNAFKK